MWTKLTNAAANLPKPSSAPPPGRLLGRKLADGASAFGKSVLAGAHTEIALSLAMGQPAQESSDFLFEHWPGTGKQPRVWHPNQNVDLGLDKVRLASTVEWLAEGAISDMDGFDPVQSVLRGDLEAHDLEFDWQGHDNEKRRWQLSTRLYPNKDNPISVVGLVRDISVAHSFCQNLDQRLADVPQLAAQCRVITNTIGSTMREQAHLIASIVDYLTHPRDTLETSPQAAEQDFALDVRHAIHRIVDATKLLRDCTDARFGCLELEPQTWPLSDILAHANPAVRQVLDNGRLQLTVVAPGDDGTLLTDLARTSRLLSAVAEQVCDTAKPGGAVQLSGEICSEGYATFTFTFDAIQPYDAEPGTASRLNVAASGYEPVHAAFCELMLERHAGAISRHKAEGGKSAISVRLKNCKPAMSASPGHT